MVIVPVVLLTAALLLKEPIFGAAGGVLKYLDHEGFYAERVLRAGAHGYVTKEEGPERLIEGIHSVLRGQIFVSERMASKVMGKIVAGASAEGSPMDSLTDRELEIFELIGNGLATRDIAQRLHISTKTVDSHREHIKEKLQLDSAADLLKHAIQWVQSRQP